MLRLYDKVIKQKLSYLCIHGIIEIYRIRRYKGMLFETDKGYKPLYTGQYFNQPIVYNGRNFILTLVREGKPGETYLIVNNGWTIKDPFSRPVKPDFPNAWIFGLYYKLSDPEKSLPKRRRVKKLLKERPEFFGCEGLYETQRELMQLLETQMASNYVILVGFTKSAVMMLNHAKYSSNVLVDAICPMFEGTLATIPDIMKKYLKWFYRCVGWLLTEHIVDEDIRPYSSYLLEADYTGLNPEQVTVVRSTFDNRVKHTRKEARRLGNLFFRLISPIMEKAIRENWCDDTGYRSNAFLSYASQTPKFKVSNLITVYGSMPMTFNHPKVRELIKSQIQAQNEKSFKQRETDC